MNLIFENKRIILGITGSIAAFKATSIARELIRNGAEVKVIMTPSACKFITPLTMSNLIKNPVIVEMFDENNQNSGAWHIEISHWCDAMVIAPCSATTIARLATGLCDTALSTVAIALPKEKPLLIAPAMDSTMFQSKQVQSNLAQLARFGYIIIPPEEGELSSGLVGPGRLPESNVILDYIQESLFIENKSTTAPEDSEKKAEKHKNNQNTSDIIVEVFPSNKTTEINEKDIEKAVEKSVFTLQDAVDKDKWTAELELNNLKKEYNNKGEKNLFSGKNILITAGPTIEKIDDVRFISNFSSGKMGYALAKVAKSMGANVKLISGPVSIQSPENVEIINVQSASEMFEASVKHFEHSDIAILSAAVADFTPIKKISGKIKKSDIGDRMNVELEITQDILEYLSKVKKDGQVVVGFALESTNEIANGWVKLKSKGCDMIVVNSANKSESGFQGDYNTIIILTKEGTQISFPPMLKEECSVEILKEIYNIFSKIGKK